MERKFLLVLLAALTLAVSTRAAVLFDRGADWRWRPGTSEASTPVETWRNFGFDDAQFTTAPSPFWFDTLGDSSTLSGGTVIVGMQNNYLCLFLRKTFVITNLSQIGGLRFGSLIDDGFVAWINGTEVLRVNMPGAPGAAVTTNTLASNAIEPVSFVTNNLPAPPSYLVQGTNIIAVQVFQSSLGSSDIGFDALLETILIETNAPVVVSANPLAGSTITNLTQITVTFSEPVNGVDAFDLVVNGSSAAAVTPVNSSTYTFTFPQPAYGNVSITWNPSHGITDQALPPNPFNASGPGATWPYNLVDNTRPVVANLSPAAGATVRSLTGITVLFSESVSGVNAADLLINGSPATGFTALAPNQFTFTFPQPPTGAVQVAWVAGHGITDQAAAPNTFAGGSWSYQLNPNAVDAPLYISEFMASNTRTLADENGDYSDWIEIYNPSALTVNLDGWSLTDNANSLDKWRFPATNLAGGGFLVVFASGKDRRIAGAQLHTGFQLSAGGEYLGLVKPDGTIVSEFRPQFPSQVPDVSYGFAQFGDPPLYTAGTNGVYFTTPTPGAANIGGVTTPGPVIANVKHTPNAPLDNDDLIVTARVVPSFVPISSVTMRYRIMFDPEVTLTMFDDGAHGDGAMADGIFGATIPASASTNGQMVRYYIFASDINAHVSRWPLFTDPASTAEYLGTVVNANYVTSALPVIHLFAPPTVLQPGPVTSQTGADSQAGSRGVSVFYDGEFYDNVYVSLRGNTTAGYNKKSHRFEFNREHLFRHPGAGFGWADSDAPRVRKTSFVADYPDPTYMRQGMSFWLNEQLGVRSSFYVSVRLQLNGQFYQLANHNDVHSEELLDRLGYDPNGALYNAAGTVTPDRTSTGGFEKKTRIGDGDADYAQLAAAINEAQNNGVRRTNLFDMLDLPQVINYLVAARFVQENDDVWANMSLYHDNDGDDLWRVVPFDMNLSWGAFYYDNPVNDTGLQATNDNHKSHPLYGSGVALSLTSGLFNRIYDSIFQVPQTREMYLRRMRTMLDTLALPPGTPVGASPIEQKILAWRDLIAADAAIDRAKWGWPGVGGQNNIPPGGSVASGVNDLLQQFFYPRRQHFYGKHSVTNGALPIGITKANNAGIPLSQPANAPLTIVGVEFNPSSGNQEQEFVCISNPAPFAVEISGWKLEGAVQFTFAPGTVLPSNSIAYVSPNVRAFKARSVAPRGGQGLFVLGPYQGQLSARGEAVRILNGFGQTVSSLAYPGTPSLAQQFLRITEIMYHPSPHAANTNAEEFEYIELKNISTNVALSLIGVHFTNGVDFNFTGSAVTSLAPGARVLVVKNLAAFNARYGAGLPVAGAFTGNLDNGGERLQLLDASNEEILDFSYDDDWHPITDGLGFSLVIVDENAQPDAWDSKSQWRPSGTVGGAPGAVDPALPIIAPILVNEVLSRTDTPPPADSIELFNPTASDVNIGGWWLSDDFNAPKKFRIPDGTIILAGGYRVFTEADFNAGGAGFGFSSDGDEAWLFSADVVGNLTGYLHGHDFGAAEDGVSFGRYITSEDKEHFVAQSARTLGAANASPRVGPIVINEIMYRPPDIGTNDNSGDEFIELLNISGSLVQLYDPPGPTNTWKLTGGVDFVFPTNQSLAAGQFLLLVNFNPSDAVQLATFRAKYGVAINVQIFGPYEGKLDNSGEDVELKKPTTPIGGVVPYVLMDKVSYSDSAPWPVGADGTGLSLQRKTSGAYGNDPANWIAAPVTAGAPTAEGTAPVITGQPQNQLLVTFGNGAFSVIATGAPPLRYQWRFNGALIAGATNSTLPLTAVQPAQIGNYDVLVFNNAGSVVSSNVTLTLSFPPSILAQPQSVQVRVRPDPQAALVTNASFSVIAYSSSSIGYQWRFNGVDIPGANGPTLTISNVQVSNSGDYTVAITDPNGTLVSDPATLYALVTPSIIQPPVSQSVVVGAPVTLSVAVSGSPLPIIYEWRRLPNTLIASNVVNSLQNFFTFTAPSTPGTVQYRVVVKNLAYTGIATNAVATITALADSDADGIPDVWESTYFGNPTAASRDADSDQDRMKNWEEYVAGTDPTNTLSHLRIEPPSVGPGTMLRFTAISNRTYTVQFTDALASGPWQKLADIVARSTNRTEFVSDPAYTSKRFYRLATPEQP